jgi:hypothetical protein
MSIVITGNPGVGKHTITYEISKNLKLSIIDINETSKKVKGYLKKMEIQIMLIQLNYKKSPRKKKFLKKI